MSTCKSKHQFRFGDFFTGVISGWAAGTITYCIIHIIVK